MQMILIRSERSSDTEVTSGRDFMDAGRDPDIVYNSKKRLTSGSMELQKLTDVKAEP